MKLSDRVRLIIQENQLTQKDFAKSINVTASFISKVINDESGLSASTAALIESKYNYSIHWILNGSEPQKNNVANGLTPLQQKIIAKIEDMNETELVVIASFIKTLEEYKYQNSSAV